MLDRIKLVVHQPCYINIRYVAGASTVLEKDKPQLNLSSRGTYRGNFSIEISSQINKSTTVSESDHVQNLVSRTNFSYQIH
jgi:hypothetical protein